MYNYIGIRGHRGAGKSTISMLIGIALQNLKSNGGDYSNDFKEIYNEYVRKIQSGELTIRNISLLDIHFEAFADIPLSHIYMLCGIPFEYYYDDRKKDNIYINIRDFRHTDIKPEELYTAKEYFETRNAEIDSEKNPHKMKKDVWMTLREFISYFGGYVMKYFFGANVWLKTLQQSPVELEEFFTENESVWRIYSDIKFTSELDYIKSKDGIVINISRKNNIKKNFDSSTNLIYDNRFDYSFEFDEISTEETYNTIINLSKKIYDNKKDKSRGI